MKREFSAGGLVYKKNGAQLVWLVRRPTPSPNYRGNLGWSFPKGWIDKVLSSKGEVLREETPEEAAVREEGGVVARIVKKLETVKLFFTDPKGGKVMKFVTYFVMEYESEAKEGHDLETEEIKWVTIQEAEELLAFKSELKLLQLAEQMTGEGGV